MRSNNNNIQSDLISLLELVHSRIYSFQYCLRISSITVVLPCHFWYIYISIYLYIYIAIYFLYIFYLSHHLYYTSYLSIHLAPVIYIQSILSPLIDRSTGIIAGGRGNNANGRSSIRGLGQRSSRWFDRNQRCIVITLHVLFSAESSPKERSQKYVLDIYIINRSIYISYLYPIISISKEREQQITKG